MTGIYSIYNTVSNKTYIGSSTNIQNRWRDHASTLQSRTHDNKHLTNSWHKYGCTKFRFQILELCDEVNLLTLEQAYINEHVTKFGRDSLYNINLVTTKPPSFAGCTHTEESKFKMSEARVGKSPSNAVLISKYQFKKGENRPSQVVARLNTPSNVIVTNCTDEVTQIANSFKTTPAQHVVRNIQTNQFPDTVTLIFDRKSRTCQCGKPIYLTNKSYNKTCGALDCIRATKLVRHQAANAA